MTESTFTLPALVERALAIIARADTLNSDTQWSEITAAMDEFGELVAAIAERQPETDSDAAQIVSFFVAEVGRSDAPTTNAHIAKLIGAAKRAVERLTGQQAPISVDVTSTTIPSLGMTFAEAAAKAAKLAERHDTLRGEDDITEDLRDELYTQLRAIRRAILAAEPKTFADVVALLDRLLCVHDGLPTDSADDDDLKALHVIRALLAGMAGDGDVLDTQPEVVVESGLLAGMQAVTPAVDPLADIVEEFAAEAPAHAAPPELPTIEMVDAATTAAGITPDQFRTAYGAAITVYLKERAA